MNTAKYYKRRISLALKTGDWGDVENNSLGLPWENDGCHKYGRGDAGGFFSKRSSEGLVILSDSPRLGRPPRELPTQRECRKCYKVKPITDFHLNTSRFRAQKYRKHICRECCNEQEASRQRAQRALKRIIQMRDSAQLPEDFVEQKDARAVLAFLRDWPELTLGSAHWKILAPREQRRRNLRNSHQVSIQGSQLIPYWRSVPQARDDKKSR